MSDEEAGRLTLRQVYALLARHNEAERRADYRSGVLASLISGFGKAKPPAAFFPSLADGGKRRMDDAAIYRKLQHLKAVFAKE